MPSRLHKGRFFALPQSPQILKQLTMVAGFDRYYQIAICFRDEDLRADRVQEITQLDVEMAFPEREVLLELIERTFAAIWRECLGVEIETPFPRMSYEEADRRFGSDKPDTRFGLEIEDATELTRGSELGVFANAAAVRFLRVPRAFSRAELRGSRRRREGAGGEGARVPRPRRGAGEVRSPIAKFLSEDELEALRIAPGESLLFCADAWKATSTRARGICACTSDASSGSSTTRTFAFLWVDAFPMFEWDEDEQRWSAVHHPFTRPTAEWRDRVDEEPGAALAEAYDLIVNGNELGGGSFRIHEPEIQAARLRHAVAQPRGAAREVRLPARRARHGRARRTAASRSGSTGSVDGSRRRAEHPRRDRLPEGPGGSRSDDVARLSEVTGAQLESSGIRLVEPQPRA